MTFDPLLIVFTVTSVMLLELGVRSFDTIMHNNLVSFLDAGMYAVVTRHSLVILCI